MLRFEKSVVVVTGAGSGIGAATAKRFASEGACVVLNGRDRGKLDRVASELDAGRTLVHPGDVSVQSDAEALVAATVGRFGRLDVLVNNAASPRRAPSSKRPSRIGAGSWPSTWTASSNCIRAALPHLLTSKAASSTCPRSPASAATGT